MINVLHTRACGTRDNTGNRLVICPRTECIIYMYIYALTNSYNTLTLQVNAALLSSAIPGVAPLSSLLSHGHGVVGFVQPYHKLPVL